MNFIYEETRIYVMENEKLIIEGTFPFIAPNVINIDHTYVDPSLRGKGFGDLLMNKIYDYAKEKGYTIVNTCPYAVLWFKRNKSKNDILNNDIKVEEACKI